MKKILFLILVILCIGIPSNARTVQNRMTVMPIQIIVDYTENYVNQNRLVNEIKNQFSNSPKYRLTNDNETCLQLRLTMLNYKPRAYSFKDVAIAEWVNMVSIVWSVKPKNKHAYYIYNSLALYDDEKYRAQKIISLTDDVVDMIYKNFPYVFD